jgi:hypothetical protein
MHRVGQQRLVGTSDPYRIGGSCIPPGLRSRRFEHQYVVRQHPHHLPRRSRQHNAASFAAYSGVHPPAVAAPAAAPAPSEVVRWRCPTCGRPLLPATAGAGGSGAGTAAAHGPAAGAGPAMLRCDGGHTVSVAKQGHVNLLPAGRLQPKHAAAAGDDEAMVGGACLCDDAVIHVVNEHTVHMQPSVAVR